MDRMMRVSRKFSLRTKIIILVGLLFIFTLASLGSYSISKAVDRRRATAKDNFQTLTRVTADLLDESLSPLPSASLDRFKYGRSLQKSRLTVVVMDSGLEPVGKLDPRQKLLYNTGDMPRVAEVKRLELADSEYLVTILPSGKTNYLYLIAQNISGITQVATRQILSSFLVALLTLFFITVVTLWFMKREVISPLKKTSATARKIAEGNFEERIEVRTSREVSLLTDSLNAMAERFQDYIKRLQVVDKIKDEFIILASHNLRTPVTRLKAGLERLMLTKEVGGAEAETLKGLKETVDDLEYLTEGLLDIVSLEGQPESVLGKKQFDLRKALKTAINKQSAFMRSKDIKFSLEAPGDLELPVWGVFQKLSEAFSHVLENAVKFSDQGGVVKAKLSREVGQAKVVISDKGIGIKKEVLPKLFQKFRRGTDLMNYNYPGAGIGLYLTKLIVEHHQGAIKIDSQEGRGTTVVITIPLVDE